MSSLLIITLLLPALPGVLQAAGVFCTVENLEVLEGQPVTVPCHYNPHQYSRNVKYWCHGPTYGLCSSLARTDAPGAPPSRVNISDDPSQGVFAVTMRELTEDDSGWYYCVVEIAGIWSRDDAASLYVNVRKGVSVVNKMVTGEEGSAVTVRCLYSLSLRGSEKSWCRSGHPDTCQSTGSGRNLSSASLIVSDDGKDTVTVTIKKLEMRDAGWYLCGAGHHLGAVQVQVLVKKQESLGTVTFEPNGFERVPATVRPLAQESNSFSFWQTVLIVCVILLLVTAALVTWRLWEQHKKKSAYRSLDEIQSGLMVFSRFGGECKNDSATFLKV